MAKVESGFFEVTDEDLKDYEESKTNLEGYIRASKLIGPDQKKFFRPIAPIGKYLRSVYLPPTVLGLNGKDAKGTMLWFRNALFSKVKNLKLPGGVTIGEAPGANFGGEWRTVAWLWNSKTEATPICIGMAPTAWAQWEEYIATPAEGEEDLVSSACFLGAKRQGFDLIFSRKGSGMDTEYFIRKADGQPRPVTKKMVLDAKEADDALRGYLDYHMTLKEMQERIAQAAGADTDDGEEDVAPDTDVAGDAETLDDFEEVELVGDDDDPFGAE